MGQKAKKYKLGKLKRFFLELIAKIDKKMEEKSKSSCGCCSSSDKKDKTCCS